MALKRNVGLRGIGYRGGGPMLSWMLHRIGGLAMVLFVGLHIAAGFFMQQFGSNWATRSIQSMNRSISSYSLFLWSTSMP